MEAFLNALKNNYNKRKCRNMYITGIAHVLIQSLGKLTPALWTEEQPAPDCAYRSQDSGRKKALKPR